MYRAGLAAEHTRGPGCRFCSFCSREVPGLPGGRTGSGSQATSSKHRHTHTALPSLTLPDPTWALHSGPPTRGQRGLPLWSLLGQLSPLPSSLKEAGESQAQGCHSWPPTGAPTCLGFPSSPPSGSHKPCVLRVTPPPQGMGEPGPELSKGTDV